MPHANPTIITLSHYPNTIPLFPFQSHFPLLNPTIIISIPLFVHQSHFFGHIFIIPLLLFLYILDIPLGPLDAHGTYIFPIALPLMPVRFASDHSSITWDHRSTSGLIVLKFELNLSSFVNPWQSHGLAKLTVEGYWNIQWRRTERPRKSSTPMSKTLITPVQLWILGNYQWIFWWFVICCLDGVYYIPHSIFDPCTRLGFTFVGKSEGKHCSSNTKPSKKSYEKKNK